MQDEIQPFYYAIVRSISNNIIKGINEGNSCFLSYYCIQQEIYFSSGLFPSFLGRDIQYIFGLTAKHTCLKCLGKNHLSKIIIPSLWIFIGKKSTII